MHCVTSKNNSELPVNDRKFGWQSSIVQCQPRHGTSRDGSRVLSARQKLFWGSPMSGRYVAVPRYSLVSRNSPPTKIWSRTSKIQRSPDIRGRLALANSKKTGSGETEGPNKVRQTDQTLSRVSRVSWVGSQVVRSLSHKLRKFSNSGSDPVIYKSDHAIN